MAPMRVATAAIQKSKTIFATNPGCSTIKSGPGRTPYMNRAAIRIAVGPLPGIPNPKEGISAPPEVALFALSGVPADAGPGDVLVQVPGGNSSPFAVADIPGERVQLLALEQPTTDSPPQW